MRHYKLDLFKRYLWRQSVFDRLEAFHAMLDAGFFNLITFLSFNPARVKGQFAAFHHGGNQINNAAELASAQLSNLFQSLAFQYEPESFLAGWQFFLRCFVSPC